MASSYEKNNQRTPEAKKKLPFSAFQMIKMFHPFPKDERPKDSKHKQDGFGSLVA